MSKTIGLIDVDSTIPNLALMKLSAYHKNKNDSVWFNTPLFPADKVYISKVFTYSQAPGYPGKAERGGPGFSLSKALPSCVDNQFPDYSLYNSTYSLGYTSRGCDRDCPFCIVHRLEGAFHVTGSIYDFYSPKFEDIHIMDNNILADLSHFESVIHSVKKENLILKIEQGVDVRLVTPEVASLLASVRFSHVRVSWDNVAYEKSFRKGISNLTKYIVPSRIMVFILINYDSVFEEDFYRVKESISLGLYPYIMEYRGKPLSPEQSRLKQWCNIRKNKQYPLSKYILND